MELVSDGRWGEMGVEGGWGVKGGLVGGGVRWGSVGRGRVLLHCLLSLPGGLLEGEGGGCG